MKVYITSSLALGICSFLSLCIWDVRAEVNVVQSDHPKYRQTYGFFTRADHVDTDLSPLNSATPAASKPKLVRRARLWTPDEESLLLELRDNQRLSWEQILPSFPDRGWKALETKYYALKSGPSRGRVRATPKVWSGEEEEQLVAMRRENRSWAEIGKRFPERSIEALKTKYRQLFNDFTVPKRAIDRWTAEEDNYLIQLREEEEDLSWEEILARFNARFSTRAIPRTLVSLQSRSSNLNPVQPNKKGPFTSEEDDDIIDGLNLNMKLDEIAELLGRSKKLTYDRIKILEQMGRIEPAPQLGRRRYTETEREQVYNLRNEGESWEEIAIGHFPGRSISSIREVYRKYRNKIEGE